jgi:hypothetical protein
LGGSDGTPEENWELIIIYDEGSELMKRDKNWSGQIKSDKAMAAGW